MAFGAGSALARQAVGAAVSACSSGSAVDQPQSHSQQPVSQPPAHQIDQGQSLESCSMDQQAFQQCFQQSGGQISECQQFYDALQACQMQARASKGFASETC
jgi:hypothetical protein